MYEWKNEWYFRPRLCTARLNWAGDILGEWDEVCYESCPWRRIDRSSCCKAVQRATTVPRMPPLRNKYHCIENVCVCVFGINLVFCDRVTGEVLGMYRYKKYIVVSEYVTIRGHCTHPSITQMQDAISLKFRGSFSSTKNTSKGAILPVEYFGEMSTGCHFAIV